MYHLLRQKKPGIFDILSTVNWLHNIKLIDSPKVKGKLREAVLYDHSGSLCLTVWGNLIDLIEE